MILLELVAFLIGFSSAFGVPADINKRNRIVGGNPTTIENYPCAVQIERLAGIFIWSTACGGTILNPRWVLSAAHCFEAADFSPTNRRIRAGATTRASGGITVTLVNRFNHPDYAGANSDGSYDSIDHDIAVLNLAVDLVYSNVIQPCSIISQGSTMPHDNAPVTQVGWGLLRYQGDLPDVLHEVQTYVISQQECSRRHQLGYSPTFNTTITSNMICNTVLDVPGFGPCSGDSGGPMFFYGVNVGVVSWGYGCADDFFPSVSARIAPHTDWILSVVES